MTTAYWSQWSRAELMAMHDNDDLEKDYDVEYHEEKQEQHCCGKCMNCLGLSWRDFI